MKDFKLKSDFKKIRKMLNEASLIWIDLKNQSDYAKALENRGLESRPFFTNKKHFNVVNLIELCVDAFTQLPQSTKSIEYSEQILSILDFSLSEALLNHELEAADKFSYIFDPAQNLTTFLKLPKIKINAAQFCFLSIFLHKKKQLDVAEKYSSIAKAMNPEIFSAIFEEEKNE